MADSDAVRSRRKRAHAAGDHSMCRRCDGRGPVIAALPPSPPSGTPNAGDDSPVDPRAMLEGLARRLEGAHEADPGDAAVARVLQSVLTALMGAERAADGDVAKFWSEFSRA